MLKANKFLAIFLTITLIFGLFAVSVSADAAVGEIEYSRTGTEITATVSIEATTASRILVLRSYGENGLMKEIVTAKNNETDTLLKASVKAGVYEVRASVMDETGKSLTSDAVYNADTLNLRYIKINGKKMEDFTNDKDEYFCKNSDADFEIEAMPQDSSTKVSITKDTVNRKAKIYVVSAFGHVRTISITFYREETDRYRLIDFKYKVGDTEYSVPGFDPEITIYENIELPENTMSITVMPKSAGNVDVQVINSALTSLNGVTLGRYLNSSDTYFEYPRTAVGNVITIKNECAAAKVTVKSGDISTEYIFNFITPKQPRLLEMNYVGADSDSEKPTFVGGCAVYNDNGTTISSDWGYAACQISKELEGGSCILFRGNNKSSGWWQSTTSGEYFNFKVDRACTVYMLSCANMTASEWGEAGWTRVNSGTVPKFTGTVLDKEYNSEDLGDNSGLARRMRKDWNDYSSPAVYAGAIMYNAARSKDYRCINPGIKETESLVSDGVVYRNFKHAYKKHFEAEEEIKIFHTGNKSELGSIDFVVIKWDNGDNSLLYSERLAEESGISEVIKEPLVDSEIGDTSFILNATNDSIDKVNGVWKDKSGANNDITLGTGEGNAWVDDKGFMVTARSDATATKFPDAVQAALRSGNATLRFKLADFVGADGKFGIVLSNNDAKYMLCTKSKGIVSDITNVDMRLNVGTTSNNVQPSGIDLTKLNTIVFDRNAGKLYWYVDNEKKVDTTFSYPDLSGIGNINLSYTGTGSNYIGSSATFETISVYNRALTEAEIVSGTSDTDEISASETKLLVNASVNGDLAAVIVLNAGHTFDEVTEAINTGNMTALNDAILYFAQAEAENGKASIEIPMPSGIPDNNYPVYIDGTAKSASYTESLTGKVTDYINNIEYFADSIKYNGLSDKQKIKAYTSEILSGENLTADAASVEKVKAATAAAILIEMLNEGKISDYKEIEEATGAALPAIPLSETAKIKEDGKQNILSALSGKSFATVAAYKKAYAEEIFINAINNNTTLADSTDRLDFFNAYAALVGLDLKAAGIADKSVSEALAKLAAENAASIAVMQAKLKNIAATLQKETPITNKKTGGGGGGGGVNVGGPAFPNGIASNNSDNEDKNNYDSKDDTDKTDSKSFIDMSDFKWAEKAVYALREKGIISGYEDETYKPYNSVTRAEFITMMVKAYIPEGQAGDEKFNDVSRDDWFYDSVMIAFSNGIVNGVSENEFMPKNQIKRQDMAVILYNLACKLNKSVQDDIPEFVDEALVSDYAKIAVKFLKAAGVVNGDENGAFNPQSYANRAEAAQMIYTFMTFVGEGVPQ